MKAIKFLALVMMSMILIFNNQTISAQKKMTPKEYNEAKLKNKKVNKSRSNAKAADNGLLRANVIAISPFLKSPKIKLEHAFPSGFSMGTNAKFYLGDTPGITAEPFGRYYFRQHAPKGFYMQGKGIIGWNKSTYSSLVDEAIDEVTGQVGLDVNGESGTHNVFNYGFGIAGGYQFLLGRSDRFAIDLLAGYQRTNNSGAVNEEDLLLKLKRNFPVEMGIKLGIAF